MCKIKNCKEQKIYAKGYCHYHYLKQWKEQLSPEKRQRLREQALKYHHSHKHETKYRARIKKYCRSSHGKIVRSKIARNFRQRLKLEVLKHYSIGSIDCPRCVNCGFEDMRALCLDHIDNNGATHRKELFVSIYSWLKNNNYPDGFQVLCANCNLIKEFEIRRPKYED